jgi:hypothetical protein
VSTVLHGLGVQAYLITRTVLQAPALWKLALLFLLIATVMHLCLFLPVEKNEIQLTTIKGEEFVFEVVCNNTRF